MGRPCSHSTSRTSAPAARAHHSRSPRALSGSSGTSRPPPGSDTSVPAGEPAHARVVPRPSGSRSSTAHRPSSPRAEKCTTTRACPIRPSTAAASVGEVFTTSRSPARSSPGSSRNA
ncbi:hypothetical protein GCM10017687_17150 [Streptomyces echinatus]|uniref:Uncharacterized protein n=1 Tax=Streptomyces echinatus TaxID=67293 RepID=A0A7W9UTZ6_9ACTN|nr:hypothetical protein [Streptomyces echinatus]